MRQQIPLIGPFKRPIALPYVTIPFCGPSLLAHFGKEIVGMDDVGDLFGFLQELPTKGWGEEEVAVLVGQAFILKR